MTKLLILSSDTGEGHNSVALALEKAAAAAKLSVSVRKPIEMSSILNRVLANFYNFLLARRPKWIGYYFRLINGLRPNESDVGYRWVRSYVRRFIDLESPDVILSVHPMLNHFVQRFVREDRRGIPCFTFVTDPFPPFWQGWASPDVTQYFVASEAARDALVNMKVPREHIDRVEMPVRPEFQPASPGEIHSFRATFKLTGDHTILINGGARGGGSIFRIHQSARRAAPDANVLVICGRNSRLRRRIERLGDPKTRAFGFLEDIHRYVAASDLVITKPGALSTYEALACRVPAVLAGIGGVMPQESGLFNAASTYDFGFAVRTIAELEEVLAAGPSLWRNKERSITRFYKPSNGAGIIERIQPAYART